MRPKPSNNMAWPSLPRNSAGWDSAVLVDGTFERGAHGGLVMRADHDRGGHEPDHGLRALPSTSTSTGAWTWSVSHEQLGMVWSLADERFQENLEAAKAYYDQHWTLCAPRSATALDRPVWQWLSNLRRPGALEGHPKWKTAPEAVDEDWNPEWPADWQRHYAALRKLMADEKGQADVLPGFTVHGMDIGKWLAKQRKPEIWQALAAGQRERLEQLGITPPAPGPGGARKALHGPCEHLRERRCGPRPVQDPHRLRDRPQSPHRTPRGRE